MNIGQNVRTGINNMPFRNDFVLSLDSSVPEFDPTFCRTYADVTDQRCHDLLQSHSHRPWIIAWSGGIDSTTVVASLYKNLNAQQLSNVTVALNHLSVYENPVFYQRVVRPHFQTILITDLPRGNDHYVISGHLNDQLCPGGFVPFAMASRELGANNIFQKPDALINFISRLTDPDFAVWFYEHKIENIQSTGLPIHTYDQFWWWMFFNHMWVCLKWSGEISGRSMIPWFDTPDYQQWAMHRNLTAPAHRGFENFKLDSKRYIFGIDGNHDYLRFKTKFHSSGLASHVAMNPVMSEPNTVLAWLDDDRVLTAPHDTAELLTMLPDHINI